MVAAESLASADLTQPKSRFAPLLGGLITAGLLIFIPLGVTKPMPVGFLTHAEMVSLVLIFFSSLPVSGRIGSIFVSRTLSRSERLLSLGWLAYMALYLTSCLICQRLHVGHFVSRRPDLGYAGDALLIAAIYLIYAKPPLVAYPRALAVLIAMAGLSLAHLAWFPLTALPGMLVILAWQIGRAGRLQPVEEHFETLTTPEKRAFLVKPNEANLALDEGANDAPEILEVGSGSASSEVSVKLPQFKIVPFIY
jgi:hypothetical protein